MKRVSIRLIHLRCLLSNLDPTCYPSYSVINFIFLVWLSAALINCTGSYNIYYITKDAAATFHGTRNIRCFVVRPRLLGTYNFGAVIGMALWGSIMSNLHHAVTAMARQNHMAVNRRSA